MFHKNLRNPYLKWSILATNKFLDGAERKVSSQTISKLFYVFYYTTYLSHSLNNKEKSNAK